MRAATDGGRVGRARLVLAARRRGARIERPFRLAENRWRHLQIGRGAVIGPRSWLILNPPDGLLVVGEETEIGAGLIVACGTTLRIGARCRIGPNVSLLDQMHDYEAWILPALRSGSEPRMTWAVTEPRPVVIGDEVCIGPGAVIMPGVTLEDGAHVEPNAVVEA